MRNLFIILFCLPTLIYAQSNDEQIAVKYSADHKLPLLKKMLKKTLPKAYTVYYSDDAYRVEFSNSFSLFGADLKIEGFQVDNYSALKSLVLYSVIAEKDGEGKKDTTDHIKEDISIDSTSKINYTGEEKTILGYKCVGFTFEDDESKMKGFLTTEFSAIGAIIDGVNYGLPMYLEQYNKEENMTEILRVESVNIEPLKPSYYLTE